MTASQINLSASGPQLSRFVAGMMRLPNWQLTTPERDRWIQACLEMGITTFDHADIYGSYTCEQLFGEALAYNPALRRQMQLITKCGIKMVSDNRPSHRLKHYDTSREHILGSVDNSLQMLQTDYIDLLLIHRPDPLMEADEVAQAFTTLKQAGKVLHFGVSNFQPWQFDLLASRLEMPLVTNQVELSVMNMTTLNDGPIDMCHRLRISPMVWSPLGGRDLFESDEAYAVRLRQTLAEIGEALGGATIDQVALAWLLRHPAKIVPILGSSKISRLQKAVETEQFWLTREQWFAIWQASTGTKVP